MMKKRHHLHLLLSLNLHQPRCNGNAISIAKLNLAKEATVVFFASALFTSFFVAVTVLARHNEVGKMPFLIALPTAIALYFANLLTTVTSGGYNNPVVALIIILQNKKYYFFYPL